jgi:SAM-dependent methyltransferase
MNSCRICGGSLSSPYLDLGKTPLANSYLQPDQLAAEEPSYELAVVLCKNCHLSQLTNVVPPKLMFDHYLYVSSTTQTFRAHCDELVSSVLARLPGSDDDALVLDIASNDGCLLSYFKARGLRIVGVDPAKNLVSEAIARGVETQLGYWDDRIAEEILASKGHPKVVTATNVLAHVDDIHSFLGNVHRVLEPGGLFVCEVPYMVDLVDHGEFDTIYHEHLSYFLLGPLREALRRNHLEVIDVEHRSIHGGTIRVYCTHSKGVANPSSRVSEFVDNERRRCFFESDVYDEFAEHVKKNRYRTLSLLDNLKAKGNHIAGYGASAKGNTLLNYFGLDAGTINYIVDDNPRKHGYHAPGSKVPITAPSHLDTYAPQYLLILAWNFVEEIKRRTAKYRDSGGKYIVPVPTCRYDD